MLKDQLENVYRGHHEDRGRYGYLFCHGVRGHYLKKWIGQGKRVLDLGCRDGMLTAFYANGNQVIGADIDRKALELTKNKLGIETLWVDLNQEWPFEEKAFDVIVACELLEHIFLVNPFLNNIQKSLKKGGLFIGSVPNAFRMRNRWKFLFGHEYENDPTHVRQFSVVRLERTLRERFNNLEVVPIQGKVLPFLPVSPILPVSLNRLFARDLLWKSEN